MRKDDQEMELAAPVRLEPSAGTEGRVTDGDLLLRIANGDSAAFDILYRRFARPLYGLALRMLRDRSRAEDAVQETFAGTGRALALRGRAQRNRRPRSRARRRNVRRSARGGGPGRRPARARGVVLR